MNYPRCDGETCTYRHPFAKMWCTECGFVLREEGSQTYTKEALAMMSDNYDPANDLLEIKPITPNLPDGLYLVYNKGDVSGPSLLKKSDGKWFSGGFDITYHAKNFHGAVGPVPSVMR